MAHRDFGKCAGDRARGIYDIKEEKRKLAEEAGFHTYETEEAMLADESIDVILVATPNDTHRPIALRAMEAGKNVIVEKPATLSLKELTELEDMAGKTGQFLTVHQNRRWDEDLLTVREILKDQTMGEIFRIESRVHGSRGIPGDWRKEKHTAAEWCWTGASTSLIRSFV